MAEEHLSPVTGPAGGGTLAQEYLHTRTGVSPIRTGVPPKLGYLSLARTGTEYAVGGVPLEVPRRRTFLSVLF